jgi:PAS domain S-box-containing protein
VSTPSARSPNSLANAPLLRSNMQPIAEALVAAAGAWACYLALADRAGQTPRQIVGSRPAEELPAWRLIDGAALVRRALSKREALVVRAGDWPALVLPLIRSEQLVGAALLLYTEEHPADMSRAGAAASLAAYALDAAHQIATLHFQAEEIEERTRLREIQISRNLIRGIIDSVPMELALLDSGGTVLAANRTLAKRFGLEPVTLVSMTYGAVLGSWEESPAALTFATGQPQRMQRALQGPEGQVLLEMISIPLMDHEGQPHQVVEVWEDITERVALQTQLIRVEKLAAIGQLAASIAHEVGNPLQAIQGFLALFLEQCAPETPNRRFLELAEEEIERIVHVLARLRDLYRPRADVVALTDVNVLVESILLLTGKQLERGRIRVLCELTPALPSVWGVADQLKQVLLNLVLNAAEAMPDGGLLHVQTYTQHELAGEHHAVIAITDTGTGIAPDQLPFIFDGLHTTKERGMGLGLYTSKAIIERHMGRICAHSTADEGTTFTIMLPINEEEQMA